MVGLVGSWGIASFENDATVDWFLLVEEAPDPGVVMASAIDDALKSEAQPANAPGIRQSCASQSTAMWRRDAS
jgi:hypothetical protein